MSDQSIRREFIHGTYGRNRNHKHEDVVLVKEHLHYPDGTIKPNLRVIKNYQRPFWITKPEFRDHKDKKEFEVVSKLEKYTSTQAALADNIKRALGIRGQYTPLRELRENQYVYGIDIATPVLIAKEYKDLEPDLSSDSTLAVMDYETDVLNGTEKIVSGSISMKDKCVIAVTRDFMNNRTDQEIIEGTLAKAEELIPTELKERGINLHEIMDGEGGIDIHVCENNLEVVRKLMGYAHKWMPDYLCFWNMKFDIGKIIEACEEHNYDPAHVLSDPRVPPAYRHYNWLPDSDFKENPDGNRTTKHPADQWHKLESMASFVCIDLMSLFKKARVTDQQRPSYSLDAILDEILKIRKLKIKELEGVVGLDWHIRMQRKYKFEYLVYNAFDCISVEMLDEETGDCSKGFRGSLGISQPTRYASNPKRLADDLHFEYLEKGKVIACTSADMTDELCNETPIKKGWIITLASELEHNIGVKCLLEFPMIRTNISLHAFDVDIKSAYPTGGSTLNVSKSTKYMELCSIIGLDEYTTRAIGINLTNTPVNALEIAAAVYDYPDPFDVLAAFEEDIANEQEKNIAA